MQFNLDSTTGLVHKCPECGESHYQELYTTTTCLYCPPVYEDGVIISNDRNKSTTHYRCCNCGNEFKI